MKKIFYLILAMVMLVTFVPGSEVFAEAKHSNYYQYIASHLLDQETPDAKIIANGANSDRPSQIWVNNLSNDNAYMTSVTLWEMANFTPGQVAQDVLDKIEYYDAVIFAALDIQLNSSTWLDEINSKIVNPSSTLAKAITTTVNEAYKVDLSNSEDFSDFKESNPDGFEKIVKEILGTKNSAKLGDAITIYKAVNDGYKTLDKYCEYLYSYMNMVDFADSMDVVFSALLDKCYDSNLEIALKRAKTAMKDEFSANLLAFRKGVDTLSASLFKSYINRIWNSAFYKVCPLFAALSAGQTIGRTLSNFLFSTDKNIEQFYAMQCLVEFEETLIRAVDSLGETYLSNSTEYNAIAYLNGIDLLYDTYALNCDYAKEYARIAKEEGLISKFSGYAQEYSAIMNQCDNIKSVYKTTIQCLKTNWVIYYIEDFPSSTEEDFVNGEALEQLEIYHVTFDTGIYGENIVYTYTSADGNFTINAPTPYRKGYIFGGWYKDLGLNTPLTNNTTFTGDATFYAKWLPMYKYTVDSSNNATITGLDYYYTGQTVFTIPSTIDGYRVTTIGEKAFWHNDIIHEIVLEEGITVIESMAFGFNDNLKNITIPTSMEIIRSSKEANVYDNFFENVYISDLSSWCKMNIESDWIAENIYLNGKLLTDLAIPEDVTRIKRASFMGVECIKTITFGSNVTVIEDEAFEGCTGLSELTVCGNVETIGDRAFYGCTNLKKVVLQEGVKHIDDWVFADCKLLEEIYFPDSIETVGKSMFFNTQSVKVYINDLGSWVQTTFVDMFSNPFYYGGRLYVDGELLSGNIVIPEGVEKISDYAFSNYENITSVTFPKSLKTIGMSSFYNTGVVDLIIPEGVTFIGNNAFYECTDLRSIDLPASLEVIGSGAFSSTGIVDLTVPEKVQVYSGAFKNCTALETVTLCGDSSFGSSAFSGCKNIKSVYTPSVEKWCSISFGSNESYYIGGTNPMEYADNIYVDGEALTDLVIPETVTQIGDYQFSWCKNIKNVVFHNKITSIGMYAFLESGIEGSVVIPESVTSVGQGAFQKSHFIERIYFPSCTESIGYGALRDCAGLKEIVVDEKNEYYCTVDGSLLSKDKKSFIHYPVGKDEKVLVIPTGVEIIEGMAISYAFPENTLKSLETIILHDTVKQINLYGIRHAPTKSIVIPESVTEISIYANAGTIYGNEGSYAQTYATENSIPFSVLGTFEYEASEEDIYVMGVQLRLDREAFKTDIRYITRIRKDFLEKHGITEYSGENVKFGSLVLPYDLRYMAGDDKLSVVNKTTEGWMASSVPAVKMYSQDSEYVYYTVCLTDIGQYERYYAVRPYVICSDNEIIYGNQYQNANLYNVCILAAEDFLSKGKSVPYAITNIFSMCGYDETIGKYNDNEASVPW